MKEKGAGQQSAVPMSRKLLLACKQCECGLCRTHSSDSYGVTTGGRCSHKVTIHNWFYLFFKNLTGLPSGDSSNTKRFYRGSFQGLWELFRLMLPSVHEKMIAGGDDGLVKEEDEGRSCSGCNLLQVGCDWTGSDTSPPGGLGRVWNGNKGVLVTSFAASMANGPKVSLSSL